VIDIGRGVKLVTRAEWRARAPRSTSGINPTFGVTAHWEGPHMGWPWAHGACASLVRGIQAYHMDRNGWSDIAYSAVCCGHGYAFEGRWIGRRTAANGTNHGNSVAYAVCYLNGQGDPFTSDGRRAMRAAMDYLDARGGAGPGRNGHRDWKATACPGDVIYRWVHSGLAAEEDDMDIADLRRELTTGGTPTRSAIRDLARLGARDALTTGGDPARTAVLDLIRRAITEDREIRAAVVDLVRRAVREEEGSG
jgi:hypothetical protein